MTKRPLSQGGHSMQPRLPTNDLVDVNKVFGDGGNMGALMRSIDWSRTPLGPVSGWSQALRTTVGLVLRNRFPLVLWWGPRLVQFYNDAYSPLLEAKHPQAMGQPVSECWPEIWHIIGPMIEAPFSGQPATWSDDLLLLINRKGLLEETHFKVAYSPVPDDTVQVTGIGGVLGTVAETTEQVYGERQLKTLRDLDARALETKTPERSCETAASTFKENPFDVPFALVYLIEADGKRARLASSCGFDTDNGPANPTVIDLQVLVGAHAWPLSRIVDTRSVEVVTDVRTRFGTLPRGRWSESPRFAIGLPLSSPDQPRPYGVLIAGCNPHRQLDDGYYRPFFELAAAQVTTAIRNANAFEGQRWRAAKLAEIDRAKTAFFSNVSHELRTPLTLILGPLEDALGGASRTLSGDNLETAYRNALRLLKLVNALLDLSRIDADRVQPSFEPTDLGTATIELAGVFRAAIERAGLRLIVHCDTLPEPVYVDREMWEKTVLNLLSNAFKFTFEGEINVTLRPSGDRVELTVRDSGVGISPDQLPRVFERFYRVEGAKARTHEGSGIGLALVQELVRMHGGDIRAESELGKGTTFAVSIPFGSSHLPTDRIAAERTVASTATRAAAFADEALRWLPGSQTPIGEASLPPETVAGTAGARILLADDNADMRDYVARLLREHWEVHCVADGEAALAALNGGDFDLVLADVMMPLLDGFGLLRAIKSGPRTQRIPVIMLSARAGDESRVASLSAGADDYLIKPFSARELLARISTHLQLGRVRQEAAQARSELEQLMAQMREVNERLIVGTVHAHTMTEDAEQANHLKDEFLATVSHELRTPLNAIMGWARMLGSKQLAPVRATHAIATIERNALALAHIIEDLLDVSRIVAGTLRLAPQPVDLVAVAQAALDAVRPLAAAKNVQLAFSPDLPAIATVSGDAGRLEQVIWNLLSNAIKFTPEGGRVDVFIAPSNDHVEVRVVDTGQGITPDFLPHVFDRFRQADGATTRRHTGLGVGLAIVRQLVELHGGTVHAASHGVGRGATFTVRLPISAGEVQVGQAAALGERRTATSVASPMPRSPRLDELRILLVDDNPDGRMLTSLVLTQAGASVNAVASVREALQMLDVERPDVLVSDISLPDEDGYALIRQIRQYEAEHGGFLPAVALTGYARAEDRTRSLAAGFQAHVPKPVEPIELATAIATITHHLRDSEP